MKRLLTVLLCAAAIWPLTAAAEDMYTADGATEDIYTDGPVAEEESSIQHNKKGFLGFGTAQLPAPLLQVACNTFCCFALLRYFYKTRGL